MYSYSQHSTQFSEAYPLRKLVCGRNIPKFARLVYHHAFSDLSATVTAKVTLSRCQAHTTMIPSTSYLKLTVKNDQALLMIADTCSVAGIG